MTASQPEIHECAEMRSMAPRKTTIANLGTADSPHFPDRWHLSFPTHDDDPNQALDITFCPYCGRKLPLHGR